MARLADLPPELVLAIAGYLTLGGVNALARTNRYLHDVLDGYLYSLDAHRNHSMALFRAGDEGCASTVRKCLNNMPDIRDRKKRARAPFLLAIKNGHEEAVKPFLEHSWVDPNATEDYTGRSALAIATHYGFLEVVKLLARTPGVNINLQDKKGVTPLGVAISSNHVKIAKFFASLPNIEANSRDSFHFTPLAWAVMLSRGRILKSMLTIDSIDVNAPVNSSSITPLIFAVDQGNEKIVKILLSHPGINLGAKNLRGDTALTLALRRQHVKIAQMLVAAGASS
jgi:ankyrin repeat protein